MGFAQLKKELLEKAKAEAEDKIKEAKTKVLEAKKRAEAEGKSEEAIVDEEIKALKEMLEKREIASARLEAKKALLITKKESVEKVFEKASTDIERKLHEKDRKALTDKLLKKAESEIEIAKIYCSKADSKFLKGKYALEETEMLGGIIAENKDATVKVDYSFETMIDEIKDSGLSSITKILFD